MLSAEGEIDDLIGAFYRVFDNREGCPRNMSAVCRMFTPSAIITRVGAGGVDQWDLPAFMARQEKLLTDGTLIAFREWEVEARTTVLREIASRLSRYRKRGVLNGAPYAGEGDMFAQLCRTAGGWRISAMLWQDA